MKDELHEEKMARDAAVNMKLQECQNICYWCGHGDQFTDAKAKNDILEGNMDELRREP